MDAKTRYRRRLKVQAALTRLLEALAVNAEAGIPPDRTTALLAVQVLKKLVPFAVLGTRTDLADLLESDSDLSRAAKLIGDRKRETAARKRRRSLP
jgi:hypothetical protein